jgi:hypothetical protein
MLPLDRKQREKHARHRLVEADISPVEGGGEKCPRQRDRAGSDLRPQGRGMPEEFAFLAARLGAAKAAEAKAEMIAKVAAPETPG